METDWLKLWRELILAGSPTPNSELASRHKARAGRRNARPDQLLDFILKRIDGETTVLDIGAGNGRWTIPLARIAKTITAVEPSNADTPIFVRL